MAFNPREFVINRIMRGIMFNTNSGKAMWALTDIANPSLSITTETRDAVDAIGNRILSYDGAKNAELSGESTRFNLGLLAAQSGTEIKYATAQAKIKVPYLHEFDIPSSGTSITLPKAPWAAAAAGIPFIYKQNKDSSLSTPFPYAVTATAAAFTFETTTLTFPTGSTPGDRFLVLYDYEADGTEDNGAAEVTASAKDFPVAGKFVLYVLGSDPCDVSTEYMARVVFGNAKLLGNADITFTTDGTHPFTIQANQDYCDPKKLLFSVIIPE